ncbi:cell division protein FtsY [Peptoclostridium acidaminophilum DSM 3953]|uniref:Signal recognition particle receptor FtsY n=1 Tax=Peptoclostridium acidaminophilum DSM 3953 TaxID=1286171 RepID=W8TFC1_PEPAC|nr:signal recognition particle-docking protein FtsY [Peptoclostridium acidaminophilum]AHM56523.1 cell division protein FtsY [Peptoclostridium acidaminophilum DSM 3953]
MFKKLFNKITGKGEEKPQEVEEALQEEVETQGEDVQEEAQEEVQEDSAEESLQESEIEEPEAVTLEAESAIEYEAVHEEKPEPEELMPESGEIEPAQEEAEEAEAEEPEVYETIEPVTAEAEPALEESEEVEKGFNLFARLKEGLEKTKKGITEKIDVILKSYKGVDEELFEEIEEVLITSDMGFDTTIKIIDALRAKVKEKKIIEAEGVREALKEVIVEMLEGSEPLVEATPAIIMVVGVNGVGKTTTIGKLANRFKKEGKSVMLAAGDTFRAAAIDQLEVWSGRVGVELIRHSEGSDPGAVIFDAIQAAKSRKADVLICDTAGRLHNKKNLMNELGKIFKIVDREYPDANREVLLVLDATTGQNAIQQAKTFSEVADITGIVLTKLDGTAKGGVILAVKSEIDVPVKLIGVGEKLEDLQDFDARSFVEALFD